MGDVLSNAELKIFKKVFVSLYYNIHCVNRGLTKRKVNNEIC